MWRPTTQRTVEVVVPLLSEAREEGSEGSSSGVDEGHSLVAEARAPAVADDLGIHHSHVVITRALWSWCLRCGSHSQGARYGLLRRECELGRGLSGAGRQVLRRVARGFTPSASNPLWGDEG